MKPSRRLVAISASVALLLGLSGTGATARDEAADRPSVVLLDFPDASCNPGNLYCDPFRRALRVTGVRGRLITLSGREDPVGTLELLARQSYDLVIVSPRYTGELGRVAKRMPRAKFAALDWSRDAVPGRPRNVQGVVFRTSEAAYLAGWLAGQLERRRPGADVVGVVAGFEIPPVLDFVVGFRAGVRRASPHTTVLVAYSNDFGDPTKCGAIASSQIAKGAGVVFDVAGPCGLGTLEAAREGKVWGVGVDTDRSALGPHILTSVLKRFDPAFLKLLRQVKAGRIPTGGDTVLMLRDDAVGLGKISPKIPKALRAGVEALRRDIVAGRVRVPAATWSSG